MRLTIVEMRSQLVKVVLILLTMRRAIAYGRLFTTIRYQKTLLNPISVT
ncbi:hypothetical protein I8751_02035 [Nostocaceae cyanobacterium CENA357]|uniref:Uncharacterized protein n=1 Tax=Atlanticothrix silvestris CENA357 TaxID=1725252 RepID=A0A8J7KVJ4_9CYAN|nr:hypothetical protein [Atlanticothrix silvestris CENA357]